MGKAVEKIDTIIEKFKEKKISVPFLPEGYEKNAGKYASEGKKSAYRKCRRRI